MFILYLFFIGNRLTHYSKIMLIVDEYLSVSGFALGVH